jgi:hypothetical protein
MKEIIREFEDVNNSLAFMLGKLMEYADDPDVMAALAEIETKELFNIVQAKPKLFSGDRGQPFVNQLSPLDITPTLP